VRGRIKFDIFEIFVYLGAEKYSIIIKRKKSMKKYILNILFSTILVFPMSAAAPEALLVHFRVETDNYSSLLENIQRITFSGSNLLLKTAGSETVLVIDDIAKISFENMLITAVPPVVETRRPASLPVAYYNIMGQKLANEPISGIYIILYDNGSTEKRVK
jgi:hypothetical protein